MQANPCGYVHTSINAVRKPPVRGRGLISSVVLCRPDIKRSTLGKRVCGLQNGSLFSPNTDTMSSSTFTRFSSTSRARTRLVEITSILNSKKSHESESKLLPQKCGSGCESSYTPASSWVKFVTCHTPNETALVILTFFWHPTITPDPWRMG